MIPPYALLHPVYELIIAFFPFLLDNEITEGV